MNLLETLIDIADTFVLDFDGTLVDGMPYQEVLKVVAFIACVPYDQLYARYTDQWNGVDEAEAFHLTLVDRQHARKIRAAYRLFKEAKEQPEPLPKAIEILVRLRVAEQRLICWTRGDERLQRPTVRRSGLEQFFDCVIVPPVKTRETIQSMLLPVTNGAKFVLIGDSYDQDIVPVEGLAERRVWIHGSKANAYRTTKAEPAPDIIAISAFADLLKPAA